MPYDEELEKRIDRIVSRWLSSVSKKMFGGICHLMNGNMLGGVAYLPDPSSGRGRCVGGPETAVRQAFRHHGQADEGLARDRGQRSF